VLCNDVVDRSAPAVGIYAFNFDIHELCFGSYAMHDTCDARTVVANIILRHFGVWRLGVLPKIARFTVKQLVADIDTSIQEIDFDTSSAF